MNDYAAAHADAIDPAVRVVLPVTGVDVVAHAHRLMNYIYVASPNLGGEGEAPLVDASGRPVDPQGVYGRAHKQMLTAGCRRFGATLAT